MIDLKTDDMFMHRGIAHGWSVVRGRAGERMEGAKRGRCVERGTFEYFQQ